MKAPVALSGIDLVSVGRVARLAEELTPDQLERLFSPREIEECRAERHAERRLAERFAAKEACLKLFPRETASGDLEVGDVRTTLGGGRVLHLDPSTRMREIMERHGITAISISTSSTRRQACAVAVAASPRAAAQGVSSPIVASPIVPSPIVPPNGAPLDFESAVARVRSLAPSLSGRLIERFAPVRRRVIRANIRQVFQGRLSGREERSLAQAFYGHMTRFLLETVASSFSSPARLARSVRVENMEIPLREAEHGRGLIVLTGHFGSWEASCLGGILQFPQYQGKFHFLRRPIATRWIDAMVVRRFRRAGLGVVPKKNSLFSILDLLERKEALVYIMDQHASVPKDGLPVEFFGRTAGTFKSLAHIVRASGAPVVPAHGWRQPSGRHVLRFEEPVPWTVRDDPDEEVLENTRAYNAAIERMVLARPEQWFWMHKRWKL